jgi:peroxiredoxin
MIARIFLAMCLPALAAFLGCSADRETGAERLIAEFDAALQEFSSRGLSDHPAPAEKIARYKSSPVWTYLPRFLAFAEADPSDADALAASKWIVKQTTRMGSPWRPLFEAEKAAWRVVEKQRLSEEEIGSLCLIAAGKRSPAREEFLRHMASRADLPGNARAFATAALAEYLAQRADEAEAGGFAWWEKPEDEFFDFLSTQVADEFKEYGAIDDPQPFRRESIELFRRVRDKYGDVHITITSPYFRDLTTLRQRAEKSLHYLEHLYVGAPAPETAGRDLDGKPLRLADYRGKVVLLSFWFTGCGPCLGSIPEEKDLVERFREEPFALLGVCRDGDAAAGQKTAAEHGMTWPSWFDGNRSITDDYNVTRWPTFVLIDAEGRIASKNVVGKLAIAVEKLLHLRTSNSESADWRSASE